MDIQTIPFHGNHIVYRPLQRLAGGIPPRAPVDDFLDKIGFWEPDPPAPSTRLWSLPDGALLKKLTGHADRITSLATSPDVKTLASGSGDHSIRLWSLPGGTLIRCLMDIAASLFLH